MNPALPLVLLLWVQLYVGLIPTWRFGQYYSFGWFVPVLAAGLAFRRWNLLVNSSKGDCVPPPDGMRLPTVALLVMLAAAIVPLRLIEVADPAWRPPLFLHVIVVCVLTHGILWKACGSRVTLGMLPVTIFALSAVPYPWQLERHLIHALTGKVMSIAQELFLLTGRPVELSGERLVMGTDVVDVTDGCSGIRSLQSLVMVALFFGELFLLSLGRRIVLVLVAGSGAVLFNTLRACWLADLHFSQGPEAAATAHDRIGHMTFALGAGVLWLSAFFLLRSETRGKLVLRRTRVALS